MKDLYLLDVPKVAEGGGCSLVNEKEDKPYDLAVLLGKNDAVTAALWKMNGFVVELNQEICADWVGIYRRVKKEDGAEVLLKVAYLGAISRAEFPLTEEFAAHSNNSTVGLSGKPVLVQSVNDYDGPYYQCDPSVQSEYCSPVLKDGVVEGIIDVESFKTEFFDQEKIALIEKLCQKLSEDQDFLALGR